MGDFSVLVKARRSANKFVSGVEIPDEELEQIFQQTKFAPSAFNLQHAHYVVVKNPEMKERVYEAANQQYKVRSASAAILVLGKLDAYQDTEKINEGLLQLGVLNQQEYDYTNESVKRFYEDRGISFQREEAIRNASLSAMLFMLAAKDRGWDTCPMIGFDPARMQEELNIPQNYVPALLIVIGKEDTSSQRPRGYRKPVREFVSFDRFS